MGTKTDVVGHPRPVSPAALWAGILLGPTAWMIDLCTSYALVPWVCGTSRLFVLHAISGTSALITTGALLLSLDLVARTIGTSSTAGGSPKARAHFMAVVGLVSSAFFLIAVVALAIPRWVLDACH